MKFPFVSSNQPELRTLTEDTSPVPKSSLIKQIILKILKSKRFEEICRRVKNTVVMDISSDEGYTKNISFTRMINLVVVVVYRLIENIRSGKDGKVKGSPVQVVEVYSVL